jgi:hypothetical protein
VEGASVSAFRAGEEKSRWVARAPGAAQLAWLAADEKFVYLAGYTTDGNSEEPRPESPLRVRRLVLASGKWLDDLPVAGKPGPRDLEGIRGAVTGAGQVVILTETTDDDISWLLGTGQLRSYRLTCFRAGETRPLWSKTFPSAGKVARPGAALLWAAREPERAQPAIRPLTWMGEDLLVCAGSVQDLLCLEGGTGKDRWRLERVWEYERGFIGPSVWRHFLARGGEQDSEKRAIEKGREQDEKRPPARRSHLVGGPVVVAAPKGRLEGGGPGDQHIFVAVARGPERYHHYLAECVIYELDSGGNPRAMTSLPRMVRGGRFQAQPDGVVWACQGGAMVKLGISPGDERGMGPGGPDRLCRVDWFRQVSPEEPTAWLRAGPAGDPVAFGDGVAFRVRGGGHVPTADGRVYNFPLSMINLKTGTDQALLLRVPHKGDLEEPKANFSLSKDGWVTPGPHILAVTWLAVDGKRLRITLGMEKWARTVEFDLDQLAAPKKE